MAAGKLHLLDLSVGRIWLPVVTIIILAAGLLLPVGFYEDDYAFWWQFPLSMTFALVGIPCALFATIMPRRGPLAVLWAVIGPILLALAATGPVIVSLAELEEYIVWLNTEADRAREDIKRKKAAAAAAEGFFKK